MDRQDKTRKEERNERIDVLHTLQKRENRRKKVSRRRDQKKMPVEQYRRRRKKVLDYNKTKVTWEQIFIKKNSKILLASIFVVRERTTEQQNFIVSRYISAGRFFFFFQEKEQFSWSKQLGSKRWRRPHDQEDCSSRRRSLATQRGKTYLTCLVYYPVI